ncbi:peptidase inhibitor family I36 protein [Streptomyces sp. NPDC015125]|uniref:peptidase inhibitor family I36 protein n=1 Tax=Streptomyces sp. NPDC015125 TaxID=3364938 RepID=UPI00370156A3
MISKHLTKVLLAAVSTGALLLATGPVAYANESTGAPSATAIESPSPSANPSKPVIAQYNGRQINLAEDENWGGVSSCTELPGGEVHCYDTNEEALADPALPASIRQATLKAAASLTSPPPRGCIEDYWCLFENPNYAGRVLRFSSDGKHDLGEWGFRDKLSSVYYQVLRWPTNYGIARLWDYRSWPLHDRQRDLISHRHPSMANLDYPDGGNWNDKVDSFEVRR